MKRYLVLLLPMILLAACSSSPGGDMDDDTTFGAPPPPPAVSHPTAKPYSPPPAEPKPGQSPVFKPVSDDQCGSQALQYLIGKPRTEIPVPLDPGKRRVVCSTCIITQDFRADRQTITFDTDTGLITSVKCG